MILGKNQLGYGIGAAVLLAIIIGASVALSESGDDIIEYEVEYKDQQMWQIIHDPMVDPQLYSEDYGVLTYMVYKEYTATECIMAFSPTWNEYKGLDISEVHPIQEGYKFKLVE